MKFLIQTNRAFSVAKPTCIIFAALFCIILSSCGRHPAEVLPEPVITRGTWHGRIYVNASMGFQFELPETWFVYTEEEKAVFISSEGVFIASHKE